MEHPDLQLEPVGVGAGVMLAGAVIALAVASTSNAPTLFVAAAVVGGAVCGWLASETDGGVHVKLGAFHGLHSIGLGGIVLVVALLIADFGETAGAQDATFIVVSPMGIVVFAAVGYLAGGLGSLLRLGLATVR